VGYTVEAAPQRAARTVCTSSHRARDKRALTGG
jgi:hypothetical protein